MRLIDAEQCPCNNCIIPLDDRIGCFIFPCKEFGEWYGHPVYDVDKVVEELQWYRSQDFIRREDATKIFAEHIELTTDMDEGQAMFVAEHQYRIIPKAEYRGKDNE